MATEVSILDAGVARRVLPDLAAILADCVAGGASVSFMNPFGEDDALAWWRGIVEEVEAGKAVLLGGWIDGRLAGTAQLWPSDKPNQPHRADVAKVLVHRAYRDRGLGGALMMAVEEEARRRGLTLLTLDTASGAAERVYTRCGWTRAGIIPDYALWPDGGYCDTVLYYKKLG
jgi:GNAT superfamily N-acetyltransferase